MHRRDLLLEVVPLVFLSAGFRVEKKEHFQPNQRARPWSLRLFQSWFSGKVLVPGHSYELPGGLVPV